MNFDPKTKEYFNNNIKQVFVYLTNRCQLRCRQCLYKPLLDNHSSDLSYNILSELLQEFRTFGAIKVSFLGGEPTLYHDIKANKSFSDIVGLCKYIGYEYIRVDTNGQFASTLLDDDSINKLNEITFSLDGHNEEINDSIRGIGSFKKCIANIEKAVTLNYKVQITTCIHKNFSNDINSAIDNIESTIQIAEKLGVESINFHPIFKVGVARDEWIDNTNIDPKLWVELYEIISERISKKRYNINVRLPMRYIANYLLDDFEYFNYCPLKMGERALIMPNGQVKVCAFTIGTNSCIAQFNDKDVYFEDTYNELDKLSDNKICCNQVVHGSLAPLCMSFKPNQTELIWNRYIGSKLLDGSVYFD
jgi:MoaA/NifB/PqqE/SkfB family radical SAM enzyme